MFSERMQVHYLGNEGRGTVWEEIIINCPTHIQMLAMSATVANPDDLGSWITKVVLPFTPLPSKPLQNPNFIRVVAS